MGRDAKTYLIKLLASAAAILLLVIGIACGLMIWSAGEVDRISRERGVRIVSLVLQQSTERIAHAQESSTVWDDAVLKLRERPLDLAWIDLNLGVWFSDYAGHDEVYILAPDDTPIYAMRNARRTAPGEYAEIRKAAAPLVAALRRANLAPSRGQDGIAMLTPGSADLALVRGLPAIVSAKPVVSDSGDIVQHQGREAVHLSVVYLDDAFADQLNRQYSLGGARLAETPRLAKGEAATALRRRNGKVIGYFVWHPFTPGSRVMTSIAPMLLFAFLLAGVVVIVLSYRLYRRTLDLEMSKAQAQHLAMHDALTGLPNRAMFEAALERALARSQRDGSRLALLYIDLDRFKLVNDTLGHPAGDALIREVARRLTGDMRAYDLVARLGGDEFAIMMVEPENAGQVASVCGRILDDLAAPFDLMGAQSFIGASIGVALAPDNGCDRTEVTRKADIALYKAKVDGRGRYAFFSNDLDEAVRVREQTDRELRKALADPDTQLTLLYQPIFATRTRQIAGVEALLRWNHPERGLITPLAFIALAEQTGLIEELGDWVLERALRDAAHWPGLTLSVNASSLQVRNRAFADRVVAALARSGVSPRQLEIELTESALMDSASGIGETLQHLRAVGVGIALDDFGTGYSSLSHIRDFAVDSVKIDRSFVNAIDSGSGQALIQAIVTLAHASGLRLTAEGVETEYQLAFLDAVGCENVQGFLLSHPLTAEDVTQLIAAQKLPASGQCRARKVA